jgi:type 2 lantibiotic biosynthesis protein LanM
LFLIALPDVIKLSQRDRPTNSAAWLSICAAGQRDKTSSMAPASSSARSVAQGVRGKAASRTTPGWARSFKDAYRPAVSSAREDRGLLNAVLPLVDAARGNVRNAVAASMLAPPKGDGREELISCLETQLFDRVFHAVTKTLVLELGVAREKGLLIGETPQSRYAFFCECLLDRKFSYDLLSQYPLLVRRLVALVENWDIATREMLTRLDRDMVEVASEMFDSRNPGQLASAAARGDCHSGGRAVHRLVFMSGDRLIYKPRSVAMERGVFLFTRWLNEAGHAPSLGAALALDKGGYGWSQHVDTAPCTSEQGVRRFFLRQGANVAIAHLLGASDLHYENVVAAGEYPIIVDLETLFHEPTAIDGLSPASALAYRIMGDSVTRTLLLPMRVERHDGGSADISALGYVAGQSAPHKAIDWGEWETDEMRLVEKSGLLPVSGSIPEFERKPIASIERRDEIVEGFSATSALLLRRKRQLRDLSRGPLKVFHGATKRVVFRPTSLYVRALADSWHPRFGSDVAALETAFGRAIAQGGQSSGVPKQIEKREIAQLLDGDVPYFQARVGPRSRTGPNDLPSKGWNACRERTSALSQREIDRQIWLTRVSFVGLNEELPKSRWRPRAASRTALVEAASKIGDKLCDLAVTRRGRASWLFPILDETVHLVPAVTGFDLYDGLSGIGLFLGRLSLVTRQRRHRQFAQAAVAEALAIHRRMENEGASAGSKAAEVLPMRLPNSVSG